MTTQTRLDAYLAAETKVLSGQETWVGDRKLRMADLPEIRAAIKELQTQLARETAAASGKGLRFSLANLNRTTDV